MMAHFELISIYEELGAKELTGKHKSSKKELPRSISDLKIDGNVNFTLVFSRYYALVIYIFSAR